MTSQPKPGKTVQEVRPQPKPVRELDPDYLAFVRTQPCCLIGVMWIRRSGLASHLVQHKCSGNIEAHHVSPRNGTKGTGSKVTDRRAVPVCTDGHRNAEENAAEWLTFFNRQIEWLNAEYAKLHPTPKPKRERKIQAPRLRYLKIQCTCGLTHDVPPSKVSRYGTGLRYRCVRTNEVMSVRLAG